MRQHLRFFLWVTLAALGLRLLFLFRFPAITTDSFVYGDIAKNWLQHGIYGLSGPDEISPTYIRLPGYPAFLAAVFAIFGMEHYRAVAGGAGVRGYRHLLPDRGHGATPGFAASRESGISAGGAVSVSGQLRGRRLDRDAGNLFYRAGVRLCYRRTEKRWTRSRFGPGWDADSPSAPRFFCVRMAACCWLRLSCILACCVRACLERASRGRGRPRPHGSVLT